MGQGRRSLVDPAIFELCLELKATKNWTYAKIAEYLLHHKGIANEDDPTRPVHKTTIMHWIAKAQEGMAQAQAHEQRIDVKQMICGVRLDTLMELLFSLVERGMIDTVDDTVKFVNAVLAVQKEDSTTFGVYAPKRKEITHLGGVELKGIDAETEQMLAALEEQVAANRAQRGFQPGANGTAS